MIFVITQICYIGRSRTYDAKNEETADKDRQDFIDRRTSRITELTPSHKQHNQAVVLDETSASGTDHDTIYYYNHNSHIPSLSNETTTQDGSSLKRKASEIDASLHDSNKSEKKATQWAVDFKPRVEGQVRNCQHVSLEIKEKIVSAVFQKVLECDQLSVATLEGGKPWRKGGWCLSDFL